jgi:hypothetical protein
MPKVFWFSKLQPGVEGKDYEEWVRRVDYVAAREIASLISYRVHRINGPCVGDAELPYDYIEVAEITNIDDYRRDLAEHPAALRVHAEFGKYVWTVNNFWGDLVEETP